MADDTWALGLAAWEVTAIFAGPPGRCLFLDGRLRRRERQLRGQRALLGACDAGKEEEETDKQKQHGEAQGDGRECLLSVRISRTSWATQWARAGRTKASGGTDPPPAK
ncbi:hypothetical protein PAHAL_4G339000 [Panicum hallii]|uniref:Uncharacterized protein n=1 Tax=Panicum hallii TaxID=206008 RepID=A0A2T8JEY3_9POAL|nr:hypothetical protein PAHAL_4G339000 [Panicum hallii]